MLKYNICRCCASDKLKPWLALSSSPVANALFSKPDFERHPLELNYCEDCGHLQLSSAPDPDGVFSAYKYKSGVSASFRKHFAEYANYVANTYGLGKLLEIGSNDAYLLQEFSSHGFDVIGVEPSKNLIQDHVDKKIPVVEGFFTQKLVAEKKWKEKFDYVVVNNVFAHIPDMEDVVAGISTALKPGGYLIVECGDQAGITSGEYIDNVYHEHIDYYTPYSFAKLIERVGLNVVEVYSVNTHGVSFRLIARKGDTNIKLHRHIINWTQTAKDVDVKLGTREDRLKDTIADREFIAYGAAAKAVTALYALHLVNKQLIGVVDDNELKQGYYFPGTDILITKPEDIDKDVVVLVSAWNVYNDIKAKLESRGHRGEIICMQ